MGGCALAGLVLVLAGCGSPTVTPADDTPTSGSTTRGSASSGTASGGSSPGCGAPAAAASTGPVSALVSLGLQVPTTAAAGSTLAATATITVRSDGPRVVLDPARSALLVLHGSEVVARSDGEGDVRVPLPLTAGRVLPAQTVPAGVRLVDCGGAALAAGSYTVVAVVGYGSDPLAGAVPGGGAAGAFVLVSDAMPLAVH